MLRKTIESYAALQWQLTLHPECGAVIKETGGLRKIPWSSQGKGKRGGVRIIYYFKCKENQIWFLTIYRKNEVSDLPKDILKRLKEELEK